MKKYLAMCLSATLLTAALSAPALSAEGGYPARAVTIIVPFGAGGIADALPRIVGQELNSKWGVPVVIENKVGASGNIGMDYVARATPDGYTLALAPAGNLTVNPLLYTKLPFDTAKASDETGCDRARISVASKETGFWMVV